MTRYTITTVILAAVLSGAAGFLGHFAKNTAEKYERAVANLPPANAAVPQDWPPHEERKLVSGFAPNPFSHRDGSGSLVPRDPVRRAMQKAVPQYQAASRFAFAFAKAILIVTVVALLLRVMPAAHDKRRFETIRQLIRIERENYGEISNGLGSDPGSAVDSEADRDAGEETPCISRTEQTSGPVGEGALVLVAERRVSDSGPA